MAFAASSPFEEGLWLRKLAGQVSTRALPLPHTLKKGYGVINDPFENAPFFAQLSTWFVGISTLLDFRPETALFIFHTIYKAGQHKSIFCWYLHGFVKPRFLFFFRGFFATKRPAESTGWHRCCVSTSMFICTRCVASSMFVCARITQLRSIQDACRL